MGDFIGVPYLVFELRPFWKVAHDSRLVGEELKLLGEQNYTLRWLNGNAMLWGEKFPKVSFRFRSSWNDFVGARTYIHQAIQRRKCMRR